MFGIYRVCRYRNKMKYIGNSDNICYTVNFFAFPGDTLLHYLCSALLCKLIFSFLHYICECFILHLWESSVSLTPPSQKALLHLSYTNSISWLIAVWGHKEPWHQQPWYCLNLIGIFRAEPEIFMWFIILPYISWGSVPFVILQMWWHDKWRYEGLWIVDIAIASWVTGFVFQGACCYIAHRSLINMV